MKVAVEIFFVCLKPFGRFVGKGTFVDILVYVCAEQEGNSRTT